MECELESVRQDQAEELARIAALTLREAWPPSAFRALLRRAGCRATAARGPQGVVGYIVGQRLLEVVEIQSLAVVPAWQRRGLGRRMLHHYAACARAEGASRVQLEVRRSNAPARALYAGFGFEREGLRARYYADGEDALLLGAGL